MKLIPKLSLIIFFLMLSCRVDALDRTVELIAGLESAKDFAELQEDHESDSGSDLNIVEVTVSPDAGQKIIDANEDMDSDDHKRVIIKPGPEGQNVISFDNAISKNPDALIRVYGDQVFQIVAGPELRNAGQDAILNGAGAGKPFAVVEGNGNFGALGTSWVNFRADSHGAVFSGRDNSTVEVARSRLADNSADSSGGFYAGWDDAHLSCQECFGWRQSAENGGVVALHGNATANFHLCAFFDSWATVSGCMGYIDSEGMDENGSTFTLAGCQVSGSCQTSEIDNVSGYTLIDSTTFAIEDGTSLATDADFRIYNSGLIFGTELTGDRDPICDISETNHFNSLGYNLSEDGSCSLDNPTDLENVDSMVEENGMGLYVPGLDSPLTESGPADTFVIPGETWNTLGCPYTDMLGRARPQDSNNDGVFECDRGAFEVAGHGAMEPGHSAAFFNSQRNGEGQYVEMLDANSAVVYTFSFLPDGSGPAWYTGIGYVLDNSIVINQLLRPIGTSFGDGFDSTDIVNDLAGSQNMVFNDCQAASPGGNVAYTGNRVLGIEAQYTRAERVSNILGCGNLTPHPNAGLSGSYYLPSRNGEGIVVQWLPNGQVLVIFFTYNLKGEQQWITGIGTADGFSVTIDALYPSSSTSWGSGFDPSEVVLSPWGTFVLTWTECGGVSFSYTSTVPGYGSATRVLSRLSYLWGTSCPNFLPASAP